MPAMGLTHRDDKVLSIVLVIQLQYLLACRGDYRHKASKAKSRPDPHRLAKLLGREAEFLAKQRLAPPSPLDQRAAARSDRGIGEGLSFQEVSRDVR
jgi:hypothetical protein